MFLLLLFVSCGCFCLEGDSYKDKDYCPGGGIGDKEVLLPFDLEVVITNGGQSLCWARELSSVCCVRGGKVAWLRWCVERPKIFVVGNRVILSFKKCGGVDCLLHGDLESQFIGECVGVSGEYGFLVRGLSDRDRKGGLVVIKIDGNVSVMSFFTGVFADARMDGGDIMFRRRGVWYGVRVVDIIAGQFKPFKYDRKKVKQPANKPQVVGGLA